MKTNRFWLIAPWAAFAVLAIGWMIYWHVLAGAAEQRLRAWAATQTAQGAEVEIGDIVRHGFPVLLRLELRDLAYAPARGGWRASTPRADLHIQVLNHEHIILESKAPIALARSDGAVTNISADALIASLRTRDGALAVAGIEADNLALDDPQQDGVLRLRKLVVNVRPDARAAGQYQLAIEAQHLTLPRPVRSFESFGLDVAVLRAAIVVEAGAALLDASPQDPLGPWRAANGKLRFEALALDWGPLQAQAHGEGGLDDRRRLTGRLEVPIERPGPVLRAIAEGPSLDADARRALELLALGYDLSGDDITFDLDARDGVLRLEGLPLRPLPPVY